MNDRTWAFVFSCYCSLIYFLGKNIPVIGWDLSELVGWCVPRRIMRRAARAYMDCYGA